MDRLEEAAASSSALYSRSRSMSPDTFEKRQSSKGQRNGMTSYKKQRSFSAQPDEEERQRLLQTLKRSDVFKRRWYILIVTSLLCALEGCVWNTWGPISSPAKEVFGWSNGNIALLANWGCIAYLVFAIPGSWLLDAKGLRASMLVGSFFILTGTGLRCITFKRPSSMWLINAGHILNGLSSPIMFGAPPIVSAVWFPVEQRTVATAIAAMANYMGIALSFIVGPQLVPNLNCTSSVGVYNESDVMLYNTLQLGNHSNFDYVTCKKNMADNIMHLMYGEAALAGLLFLMTLIYYPAKPPLPPSLSSSGSRLDFVAGLQRLKKKPVYWIVAVIYGISTGVYSGWLAVFDINLGMFDISQNHAGWIGFYSTVAGAVGGLAIAKVADHYSGRLRQLLMLLFVLSSVVFVWFSLTGLKVLSEDKTVREANFYTSAILGGLFLNSTVPLFYEMAAESAFPVAEGVAAVIITMLNNVFSVIFLLCLMIPHIGVMWVNWVLVASCASTVPVLFLLPDKYIRLTLDNVERPSVTEQSKSSQNGNRTDARKKPLTRRHTSSHMVGSPLPAHHHRSSRQNSIQSVGIAEEEAE